MPKLVSLHFFLPSFLPSPTVYPTTTTTAIDYYYTLTSPLSYICVCAICILDEQEGCPCYILGASDELVANAAGRLSRHGFLLGAVRRSKRGRAKVPPLYGLDCAVSFDYGRDILIPRVVQRLHYIDDSPENEVSWVTMITCNFCNLIYFCYLVLHFTCSWTVYSSTWS